MDKGFVQHHKLRVYQQCCGQPNALAVAGRKVPQVPGGVHQRRLKKWGQLTQAFLHFGLFESIYATHKIEIFARR